MRGDGTAWDGTGLDRLACLETVEYGFMWEIMLSDHLIYESQIEIRIYGEMKLFQQLDFPPSGTAEEWTEEWRCAGEKAFEWIGIAAMLRLFEMLKCVELFVLRWSYLGLCLLKKMRFDVQMSVCAWQPSSWFA